MTFSTLVEQVLLREGGYVNDPSDSGGETNYGITLAVARAYGYEGPMRDLPRDTAKAIYKAKYWDYNLLDEVAKLSPKIADELFDTGVNQGVASAGAFLQRSLNVLNQGGALYADTKVDGHIGRMTVAALREYLKRRGAQGEIVLFRALNSLQGAFYIELAEGRAKDEKYVYGWLLNRVV